MEATVKTTWSMDWTAKGWGVMVVVAGVAIELTIVDYLMDGGVVT
jgi:hypothetical protein